jgi:hypothetical protein
MKDCTTCPRKPKPGTVYELSPCASCEPWEPENDRRAVLRTMPPEFFERQAGAYEWSFDHDPKAED